MTLLYHLTSTVCGVFQNCFACIPKPSYLSCLIQNKTSLAEGYSIRMMWIIITLSKWPFMLSIYPPTMHATMMTRFLTQSHYFDVELPNPCPIQVILNARLGGNKYHSCKSLVWLDWKSNSQPSKRNVWPLRLPKPTSQTCRKSWWGDGRGLSKWSQIINIQ